MRGWGGHNGVAERGLTPGTAGEIDGLRRQREGILITSGELERIFEIVCRHEPEQRKLIKRADETFVDIWGDCGSNHRLRKGKARWKKNLGSIRMTKKRWWGDGPSTAMELGAVLVRKQ